MFAVGVVVGVDGGEAFGPGVDRVDKAAALEHLGLEGADEGFGPCVVVRTGAGRHALTQARAAQKRALRTAAVLAATITVKDGPAVPGVRADGLLQGWSDQFVAQVLGVPCR